MAKTPAWQRAEGKNPEGGLNAKGRAAYNRANPGKPGLKRPQPEGGSRRDSFCARMKGMKKKLTSAETARDPDSRINKSLRAWNCAEGGMIKKYAKGGRSMADVDRRMAELDKYLKDPDLEMVIGPTGKFQFRERKKPASAAAAPSRPRTPAAPPRPPASSRATDSSSSGALPLSAFGPKGERQAARPLDKSSKVKLRDTSNFVPAEARRAQEKIDRTRGAIDTASLVVPGLGAAGLGLKAVGRYGTRMLDKGIRNLSRRNLLTPERMSSALARTRPGEPVPSLPGASSALKSSALKPSGKSEYASSPLTSDRTQKALAALRRGEITPEEASLMIRNLKKGGRVKAKPAKVATVMREYKAGKLHSGKSKKIVRNPKQAVAIALSQGRKAARKK